MLILTIIFLTAAILGDELITNTINKIRGK